jgi:hypothetical protein
LSTSRVLPPHFLSEPTNRMDLPHTQSAYLPRGGSAGGIGAGGRGYGHSPNYRGNHNVPRRGGPHATRGGMGARGYGNANRPFMHAQPEVRLPPELLQQTPPFASQPQPQQTSQYSQSATSHARPSSQPHGHYQHSHAHGQHYPSGAGYVKQPCHFFTGAPDSCRYGDACKFSHEPPSKAGGGGGAASHNGMSAASGSGAHASSADAKATADSVLRVSVVTPQVPTPLRFMSFLLLSFMC